MKGYSTLPRSQKVQPNHQMSYPGHPHFRGLSYPSTRNTASIFKASYSKAYSKGISLRNLTRNTQMNILLFHFIFTFFTARVVINEKICQGKLME